MAVSPEVRQILDSVPVGELAGAMGRRNRGVPRKRRKPTGRPKGKRLAPDLEQASNTILAETKPEQPLPPPTDEESAAMLAMWSASDNPPWPMGGSRRAAQESGSYATSTVRRKPSFPQQIIDGWNNLEGEKGQHPFEYLARNGAAYACVLEQMIQFWLDRGDREAMKEAGRLLGPMTRLSAVAMKAMGVMALSQQKAEEQRRLLEQRADLARGREMKPAEMTVEEIDAELERLKD
jgi:hypothetical protein